MVQIQSTWFPGNRPTIRKNCGPVFTKAACNRLRFQQTQAISAGGPGMALALVLPVITQKTPVGPIQKNAGIVRETLLDDPFSAIRKKLNPVWDGPPGGSLPSQAKPASVP